MVTTINPYQQYRTQGIMTASPAELVVMLYDGLVKRIHLGRMAIEDGRIEDANASLIRAQEIIEELVAGLDSTYEIAGELFALYEFAHNTISQANISKDPAGLADVADMMSSLREAWAVVAKETKVHMMMAAQE